jgi:hypothetical protein
MNEIRRLVDSGARTQFEVGGASRELDPAKPALSLIRPRPLARLARHMMAADEKYADVGGARNFEKGMPFSRMIDGLERHVADFKDRKEDEDHLVAIFWNAYALLCYEEYGMSKELDDRPALMGAEDDRI